MYIIRKVLKSISETLNYKLRYIWRVSYVFVYVAFFRIHERFNKEFSLVWRARTRVRAIRRDFFVMASCVAVAYRDHAQILLKSHRQKCQIRAVLLAKSAFSQFALTHAWILSPIAFPYLASLPWRQGRTCSLSFSFSSNSKFIFSGLSRFYNIYYFERSLSLTIRVSLSRSIKVKIGARRVRSGETA